MYNVNDQISDEDSKVLDDSLVDELADRLSNFKWRESVVEHAKTLLYSSNIEDNIKGVINLKNMLCIKREEVYEMAQEVIDHGIISRLVEFLQIDNKRIQLPAAFCLTNIAAGYDTQTQIVVDAGAIPCLIDFLKHSDAQLRRQAIYCLANVAGSTKEYRMLLVKDPRYFDAIIFAGSMTMDGRVLELICWNLRNVCLLGGPQLEEIKPGISYLLNRVLKRYSRDHAWLACMKYAIETISSLCQSSDGREYLIQNDLTSCLLEIITKYVSVCVQLVECALEALSWILLWENQTEKNLFSTNQAVVNLIVTKALSGELGLVSQEFGLKCLLAIAIPSNDNNYVTILTYNYELFDLTSQLYLTLDHETMSSDKSASASLIPFFKEICAFLFVKALLLSHNLQDIYVKLVLSPTVTQILLSILEFAVERDFVSDSSQETIPIKLSKLLINNTLEALKKFIAEGFILQTSENIPENPVLMNCVSNDYCNRIRRIILKTPLSKENFTLCHEILQTEDKK